MLSCQVKSTQSSTAAEASGDRVLPVDDGSARDPRAAANLVDPARQLTGLVPVAHRPNAREHAAFRKFHFREETEIARHVCLVGAMQTAIADQTLSVTNVPRGIEAQSVSRNGMPGWQREAIEARGRRSASWKSRVGLTWGQRMQLCQ